ncbi:MAG: TonB-dependent receptor [Bacteroidota bacterium]
MLHKKLILIIFFISLCFLEGKAQNIFSILKIHVCDSASRLPLRNVNVMIPAVRKNLKTDNEGLVRFGLPEGQYILFAEYDGYHMEQFVISLKNDTSIFIFLRPSLRNYDIGEVTVSTNYFNKTDEIIPGLDKIRHATIQNLSTIGGEEDLVKTIATLPGISQGSEGSADIFVRGGSTDQNLYLLDNNIIYKPSHLFGFLASINPLGIEEVNFYKAAFPARFGGKLSSVIDIKTINPAMDSLHLEADISTISAKMLADIPIAKNKSGIIISGRMTYLDKLYSLFANRYNYKNTGLYDLHFKAQHRANSNNIFTLSIYSDQDNFSDIHKPKELKEEYSEYKQMWKNRFGKISYDHLTENRANINIYVNAVNYQMEFMNENVFMDSTYNYSDLYRSSITDISGGIRYINRKDNINTFIAGIEAKHHFLVPSKLEYSYSSPDSVFSTSNVAPSYMTELNSYLARDFIMSDRLRLSTGLRFSFFHTKNSNYTSLEPRIGLQYLTGESASLKGSWARTSQSLHMLTNPGLGMPMDIYIPFSKHHKPATADQLAMAYNTHINISDKEFYITLEAYYKKMYNILAYRAGYSSHNLTSHKSQPVNLDNIITSGEGESFGIECIIEKPYGSLNGWLSYSLSRTTHFFEELNGGIPFPAKHHRPHNLSLVMNYNFNKKNRISANFTFLSGERVTLPEYIYNMASFDFSNGNVTPYWLMHPAYSNSNINAYKMKDFHRLNISYTRRFEKKKWSGELEFSIYNVYNRRNSYYYYLDATIVSPTNNAVIPTLKSVSLFPMIPAVSLKIDLK